LHRAPLTNPSSQRLGPRRACAHRRGRRWQTAAGPSKPDPTWPHQGVDPYLQSRRRRGVAAKYREMPYVVLQRQTTVRGGGAAVLSSEEDGGRKGVVSEHQRHTRSTAMVLVRTGKSRVVLATCAQSRRRCPGTARSRQCANDACPGQKEASTG
jgi:hypothetical protein